MPNNLPSGKREECSCPKQDGVVVGYRDACPEHGSFRPNLPAEPTSRERLLKIYFRVRDDDDPFCFEDFAAEFDAVAKAAKLEALEKAAQFFLANWEVLSVEAMAASVRKLKEEA